MILDLLIIFGLSFTIRLIFLLIYSSDEEIHLSILKRYKQYGYEYRVRDSVPSGVLAYPSLLHRFYSIFPEKSWLREMLKPFSDKKVAGVQGAYKTRQRGLVARFAQLEIEGRYRKMEASTSVDWAGVKRSGQSIWPPRPAAWERYCCTRSAPVGLWSC